MKTVTFTEAAKSYILDVFDKAVDTEGYIVENENHGQRVLSQDGQEVEVKEFAAIKKGSEIFVKSDLISLMRLCDELSKE